MSTTDSSVEELRAWVERRASLDKAAAGVQRDAHADAIVQAERNRERRERIDRGFDIVQAYQVRNHLGEHDEYEHTAEELVLDVLAFVSDWFENSFASEAADFDTRTVVARAVRRWEGLRARG